MAQAESHSFSGAICKGLTLPHPPAVSTTHTLTSSFTAVSPIVGASCKSKCRNLHPESLSSMIDSLGMLMNPEVRLATRWTNGGKARIPTTTETDFDSQYDGEWPVEVKRPNLPLNLENNEITVVRCVFFSDRRKRRGCLSLKKGAMWASLFRHVSPSRE